MIRELFYKVFKLEPMPCLVCEVLREQLAHSEQERRELLHRVLAPTVAESSPVSEQEMRPIQPQFVPWRVKQQMLEAEDRKAAELLKKRADEIVELEKELKIAPQ